METLVVPLLKTKRIPGSDGPNCEGSVKKRNLDREVLKRLGRPLEFLLCGKSVRALALLVFPGFSGPPRDLFQAGWLGPPGLPEVLVDFVAVAHLRAGIAD